MQIEISESLSGSYLSSLGEELVSSLLLGRLLLFEQSIFDLAGVNSVEGDLGAGGQGVGLVHSLQGNSVDLVGAGNEEESGSELLEEDDALASESA